VRVNPDPRKAKPRQYIRGEASTHAGDRLIAAQEGLCPKLVYEI
jgi:hypothetical protein